MGGGLPPGAGGKLSLRLRLLAAAAGIVAVSLLLAGALTWVLVRDLEFQAVQDQLDRGVVTAAVVVRHQECLTRIGPVTNAGGAACRLAAAVDFEDRLSSIVPQLNGDRLLLLDSSQRVLFDSGGTATGVTVNSITASNRVANVGEARVTLGGAEYFAAAIKIPAARDPLGAAYVVLAQPRASAATAAAGDLATRLLEAGTATLIVAVVLALFLSRSLTRPLTQLAAAAEDVAAGNYSRRVAIDGGGEIGALGLSFNRMAEAVERARKVQRDFLANVSHELKTPLTSLIGFSQALVDGSLTSEADKLRAATIVHEESERVLRMARELLDLARVEAGSISMHIAAVDLGGQLQQQIEVVRPRASARGLQLGLEMEPGIPPVAADPERLQQVLDNLLDNAVKYAPEQSTVNVSASAGGQSVETVVANPAGPHRPDPERMFERFYRADPSRSAAAGGVGLGLAISRELVNAMGGRLWAEIDGGGELRMHLVLPASGQGRPAVPEAPAA
ncbi:MAG TPA: HAMP domain-containing sensor histidine kinase [Patescibacteria group bacterium]|nr:HAMP domain-containing sensor histidine kinase [Patescibacteria group bacterium]